MAAPIPREPDMDRATVTSDDVELQEEALTSSDDLPDFERRQRVQDNSHRLHTVLEVWEQHQSQERELRARYAKWILFALFAQIGAMILAFFLTGFGWFNPPQWMAAGFMIETFTQVVGMAYIVVRYLFPQSGNDVLDLIRRL